MIFFFKHNFIKYSAFELKLFDGLDSVVFQKKNLQYILILMVELYENYLKLYDSGLDFFATFSITKKEAKGFTIISYVVVRLRFFFCECSRAFRLKENYNI